MPSFSQRAWQVLFTSLGLEQQLENNGVAYVTADEIKELTGREPRLTTKFDTRESRPTQLKPYTILPVRNGKYALVGGDGYADLPDYPVVETYDSRRQQLQTIPELCTSEQQVLNAAFAHGLLQHFVADDGVALSIQGRRRSPRFAFTFRGERETELQVRGVQIEVDGGYEGDKLYIVEAKMGTRSNFIVRQLYYPLRAEMARAVELDIVPVFLTYSNQVFTFSEFEFSDTGIYNSIEHVRTRSYVLRFPEPNPVDLAHLLPAQGILAEPLEVPFPQANDMRKVIDVIDAVAAGVKHKDDIVLRYGFADRQASYYGDAARYLGFLRLVSCGYELTDNGRRFVQLSTRQRVESVAKAMIAIPVFREIAEELASRSEVPDRDFIADRILEHRSDISGTTVGRQGNRI